MGEIRVHQGGCHCGAVRYEAAVDLDRVVTCNCSRCSKLGWIMTFTPAEQFKLRSGEDQMTEYRFNHKTIRHLFCRICGIESFALGVPPTGTGEMAAVNVRCLDDVDPTALQPKMFNGKGL